MTETAIGLLPDSWSLVQFEEIREWLQYGTSVHCSLEEKSYPVLRIPNVELGRVNTSDLKYCDLPADEAQKYLLHDGDLLFIRTNGVLDRLGACAVYRGAPRAALFASYLIRARLKAAVDPRYVAYFYASELGASLVASRATPAADGKYNLNTGTIDSLPLALPSNLDEQLAIVGILGRAESAVAKQSETLGVLRTLKQAAMRELFARGLRGEPQKETDVGPVPESWHASTLGAHHSVVSGGTPSRDNPAFWTAGTIPWVKTTEVNYCVIDKTEEQITPDGLAGSAAKLLPAGTLLMAMYGQGVTRGKVAILGIEAACNQACAAINPTDDAVLPRYLYHFLTWRYEAIRTLAHGGQQQNLNLDIVRDLPIVYPESKAEQQALVDVLDAIDRKIDLHRRKRAVLEELFKSLLQRLVTGATRVDQLDLSALTGTRPEAAA
jgi:type I restriction enzyme S subunit